ncbi:MAG: DNA polymerase III subunit gamma/tau [Oscillospiraceae bacterium]
MQQHMALYRKYRPRTFSEVVGQKAVVESLKNQVASGKLGHAFLFTGTRGTGKTSCAKIFAKAINCTNSTNGEPCLECDICKGIENETVYDVTEMDAASNNGVDDIRNILNEVSYLPIMAKYKVYIIDEVHMLSMAAFNALLKTLEEPPAHVVFILATTELHKVPATILSRCQRYDFNRLSVAEIGEALMYTADCEGVQLSVQAAKTIASLADGAMRDAMSIFDTCLSHGDVVDEDVVAATVGVSKQADILLLGENIIQKDMPAALQTILKLEQNSVDIKRLCEELITHFRNLLLANLAGSTPQLLNIDEEKFEEIKKQSASTNYNFISAVLSALTNALDAISKGQSPKIAMDISIYTLCNTVVAPVVQLAAGQSPVKNQSKAVSTPSTKEEIVPFESWKDVIEKIEETDRPFSSFMKGSKAYLYDGIVYIDGNEGFNSYIRTNKEAGAIVKKAIAEVCGRTYNIGGYKNISSKFEEKKTDELDDILALRKSGVEVTIED